MTPFEPEAEKTRYQRPAVSIDPDRNKNWFWRVSPILLSHKRMFAVGLASALVALVFNVTIPRVTMQAIDLALVARQEPLMFYVWILLGLAVGRSAVVFLYRKLLFSLAYMIEYDLRTLIFEHIAWMPFSFFDRIQSGQLISRANSDIRAVQMFMVFGPFMLITIATFVLALGFMLSVHVALSIVSLLPIPLVYFTARRMRQFMFPVSWIVQSRLADVATIVEENISGVHIVKSFAAERQQIGLIAKSSEQLRWAAVRMNDVRAVFAPIMENLPRLATALVLGYGGYLVIRGQVTIGTLVAFSAYVIMLQTPFRLLGMLMTLSQRSAASAQRIFEILDTESEIVDRPGAVDLVDSKGEVAFRNVAFAYSDGPEILTDLSFRIKQGETVAVVGRTGSGKTTVARLLTRFYEAERGGIEIDGKDIRDLTLASLRATVGVVADESILFSISVGENIAYGRPDASFDEIKAAAQAAGAHEFIEKLSDGYETVVGERGYTLSGGQRQRIAIARTLLTNPRILILDDATSSVDVTVENKIHTALKTLMRDRSTLIIAHRLSTISLADRVLFLEDGRIAAQGPHAQLMKTEPRYVEVLAKAEEERAKRKKTDATATGKLVVDKATDGLAPLEQTFKGIN